MRPKRSFLLCLALGALVTGTSAQDRETALVNAYATLSPHIDRARTALRRDRLEKCEEEALFCLDKLPEHQEAHLLMSQVLYKRGEYGGALEHIQAAEEGYLRLTKAHAFLEQQKLRNQADDVVGLVDDVSVYTEADAAARARGSCMPDKYRKDLEAVKEKLIKEQEERGRTDPAQDFSHIPAIYSHLHGNVLFMLKRPAEAEEQYRRAIRNDPDCREAYNNLINLLYMDGRVDEARAFLSQAEAHKAQVHPELKKAVLARDELD